MRSFTPQISWHNRDPVLSVDIQNRVLTATENYVSYRLATSGNDSHIIVWKATINDKKISDSSSVSVSTKHSPNVSLECLADLTKHQRPVNVVRFSPKADDNLLAAGDDDNFIYIWKLMDDNNENQELKQIKINSPAVNKRQEVCVKNTDKSEDEIQILEDSDTPQESSIGVKPNSNPIFGEEEIANEIWKPYKILRGHIQDVSDICWSPDGQRLVSGSVDNTAIVWDIHKGQSLYKIGEHKGFVQGVTWDPMNKWLATLSADRSMRILDSKTGRTAYRVYRMRTEEDKTSRLFYDDTLRSFCRRLSFTPGGELLIAPSGILENNNEENSDNNEDSNKYINTTYIFERKSINKPSFYLPSKKYTIAVSCCPKLFQLRENLENPFPFGYRIVFAVAAQDSVLFYDSQQSLPFAQVSQIHYLRLTDISWSPDGRMLIVSSTDGFATFITFEANEIGIPYDGPKHCFEELETSSPISNTKKEAKQTTPTVETTPEVDRSKPKVSTPSITTFFKPSEVTPELIANPLGSSQNQSNCQPIAAKKDSKSINILIPRKKIKLTTIRTPNTTNSVETIDID